MADTAIGISAVRRVVTQAATQIDEGLDLERTAAKAKMLTTQMIERHLPDIIQGMGAKGLRKRHLSWQHLAGSRVAGYPTGSAKRLRSVPPALVNHLKRYRQEEV